MISPSTKCKRVSECPFGFGSGNTSASKLFHPNRPDVPLQRARGTKFFRFGIHGMVHAFTAMLGSLLLWFEFGAHAADGFSLDTCIAQRQTPLGVPLNAREVSALMWPILAALGILSTLGMHYQRWVFSKRIDDSADAQQKYNAGRGFAALQYVWIALRMQMPLCWRFLHQIAPSLVPIGADTNSIVIGQVLQCLDLAVAIAMFFPLRDIISVYPHSFGAYSEIVYILALALFGSSHSLLTSASNSCFAYHQSVMWSMMIFDGFLGYTLYTKGLASIPSIRRKITIASTANVLGFCVMFWRAELASASASASESHLSDTHTGTNLNSNSNSNSNLNLNPNLSPNHAPLAAIFIAQVMNRHINLGMFPFGVYRSGSLGQFACVALWWLWAVATREGSARWESLGWVGLQSLFFMSVWHSKGEATLMGNLMVKLQNYFSYTYTYLATTTTITTTTTTTAKALSSCSHSASKRG